MACERGPSINVYGIIFIRVRQEFDPSRKYKTESIDKDYSGTNMFIKMHMF